MFCLLIVLLLATVAMAESARSVVALGNELYNQGEFEKAVEKYDSAIALDDKSAEAVFNKADSLYRLGDFAESVKLYNDAAIMAGNDELVLKSRYNLGNCYFQQGHQAAGENPQKAIKDLTQAIGYWRKVLDVAPANEKAAGNMQIAKALARQLKEQMQNSRPDPDSQPDPNQPQDPNGQQQSGGENDPNNQQEQNSQQNSDPNQADDANENQQPQPEQPAQEQQEREQDMTAQQILEKEQQQKKQRQMLIKSQGRKVDRDW
ncbi:MAG: tetratricopeptide repeat protein [Anaerohalosphaeraceae bacterium]|nr:tetratricopeptide repeat protein [Anaerohalosphaeraceae bacterium]